MGKQKGVDDKAIVDYLAKNNLTGKAQKTENGVYYIITQDGTGPQPQRGDAVTIHYTGKLLDGKVFDSSQKTGQPIQLQIGVGMVIPGWDDAILKLKKGTKATLVIPSTMGYGPQGSPPAIPGNAVLVFDVDLVNVQKAPAAGQAPAGAPQGAPQGR